MTELWSPIVLDTRLTAGVVARKIARRLVRNVCCIVRLVGLIGLASLAVTDARAAMSIGTGNLFEEMVDYAPDGPNRLSFIRYYNSLGLQSYGPTAPLGILWRSSYDRHLVFLPNAPFTMAERATGQVLSFKIANGVAAPGTDIALTLVQVHETWVLTDRDGTVETYGLPDDTGRAQLLTIKARDGYMQTLAYNAANQLVSVTDSEGRALKFGYEGNNLVTVTTPEDLILTYHYDATSRAFHNDRLVSVSYSTSPSNNRTYLYEHERFTHALTGVLDAKGNRVASWTYDGFGRATSSQLADGANLTTISYSQDSRGNPINTVTNARREKTVYKFTILQQVPKVTEIDWPATPTAPAWTELFVYDERGYLVKTTDSNGKVTNYHPKTQDTSL